MKRTLLLVFFIIPCMLLGQKLDMSLLKNMEPRNIGPAGMSGRITAIDAVTSNPDIIYAGSASGGLWKSTSGGVTWKPVFDDQPTASIGAVAIQQSNPSVVWVGTGEGNPRNSLNGGYGVYKSLDGGKTWKSMGLENTRHIHRVVIDPTDPNTVYVGAIGSPWGEHSERGLYRTRDGGKSWEKILFTNNRSGIAELVMDPSNPNKLIAAMWEHKRDPWFFHSGGPGSGLYITYDGGDTWKEITSDKGLPEGDLGRMGLAIAASDPDRVYAYVEAKKNALYRSDDGGENWTMVNDDMDEIGNRPFYYAEIYVAPNNENRVYSIFTYVNVSEDGGKSFKELMPAYGVSNGIHPDHHAWYIHPQNPDFMMDGNDGGLNITRDGGKTWRFVENLPVGQFYHVSVDNEIPYNVYGGMQDNGSWRGPAYVLKAQGIRNSYWQEISFGDGFDVVPDRDNSQYGWTMSQQGYVSRYDWVTGNNYLVRPTHPDPEVELRFNWNSAINIDPFDNSTVYFGSQFVHRSTDKGLTWEVISPDLTTNDPEKQKQMDSGGLTMDATGAENHTTILVIEPSPVEQGMIWTGSDDGKVFYTRNGGGEWNEVSKNLKGLPAGSWIAQIKASAHNKGEALLVANNYRRYDYEPYVYRTKNYGKSWERIVGKDDALGFAQSIIEDPKEPNLMFLGTDDGLYISLDAGKNWEKWKNGFPTVPVKDMVIHPREHDLVIGTFGRSFWVLDDISPLRMLAGNENLQQQMRSEAAAPLLEVIAPSTTYLASIQQPTGLRFGADATFQGENRSRGAEIRYFFKPEKQAEKKTSEEKEEGSEKEESDVKKDSVTLKIYDGERLIRTLKEETPDSTGIYSVRWYLNEKGADRPSRKITEKNGEPGGVTVEPGTYKLVMDYAGMKSTADITVKSDPRLELSEADINEIYAAEKELESKMQLAADAVKQLVESKNTAEDFKSRLKKEDKEKYKEEIEASTEMIKKLEEKIALFLGEEDDRQGIVRSREMNAVNRLNLAASYVGSRPAGITGTEDQLISQAETELKEALEQVNSFYKKEWPAYRSKMEQVEISPFKEVKMFSL
ncbi:VPS10 domain-containing protein [Salinimicrobium flavum]|uniref:Sortilin N-terminal domain-containing protein n=1 Tax=Salinimicrobium flavum TaxID=1737065 RepID=A0ABW5IV12_9FLAO